MVGHVVRGQGGTPNPDIDQSKMTEESEIERARQALLGTLGEFGPLCLSQVYFETKPHVPLNDLERAAKRLEQEGRIRRVDETKVVGEGAPAVYKIVRANPFWRRKR